MQKQKSPASRLLWDEVRGTGLADDLEDRLSRYSTARRFSLSTSSYLLGRDDQLSSDLLHCGEYLVFRRMLTGENPPVRLSSMQSCHHPLLCPLCSIRRASRMVDAYWRRWEVIHEQHPDLSLYLVTLTVRDGSDLQERWWHLRRCVQQFHNDRFEGLRGRRWCNAACAAAGAVWSYEFKIGAGSGLWHPHVHAVWACSTPPRPCFVRCCWWSITGDSWITDVRPIMDVSGFIEVFKYSLKFSTMSPEQVWTGYRLLHGLRFVGSFGCFRGVEVPAKMTDDLDDLEGAPYVDLLFRYLGDRYRLRQMSFGQPALNDPRLDVDFDV